MVRLRNKNGDFTGLFIFIIFTFIIIMFSVIFIYIGQTTEDQLKRVLGDKTFGTNNDTNATIDATFGKVNNAYAALYWIALFLIVAEIISIFIGSYLVTTRPIFFVPWIFLVFIAVLLGSAMSNAYERIMTTPQLADIFSDFIGANEIMLNLPLILTIVGFAGGIIMFSMMGRGTKRL